MTKYLGYFGHPERDEIFITEEEIKICENLCRGIFNSKFSEGHRINRAVFRDSLVELLGGIYGKFHGSDIYSGVKFHYFYSNSKSTHEISTEEWSLIFYDTSMIWTIEAWYDRLYWDYGCWEFDGEIEKFHQNMTILKLHF